MPSKRMRRVLLAWELGGGMGHASRLLQIAIMLRQSGYIPIVAAANPRTLKERYKQNRIPLIQAPINQPSWHESTAFKAASYSDLLGVGGFACLNTIQRVVSQWDEILHRYQPDIIIADYAPLLSLACFQRIPVICFGDGFVVPHAANGSFPNLRQGEENVWSEQTLLDNAIRAAQQYNIQAPTDLPSIVQGQAQIVSVIKELDIYGSARDIAKGPLTHEITPIPVPNRYHLCVYLHYRHPLTHSILTTIAQYKLSAECLIIGASNEVLGHWVKQGLTVLRQASNIKEMFARASVCVHHAGINMTEEAILAGRYQVLLPRHFEQRLNTQQTLSQIKACVAIANTADPQRIEPFLTEELNDSDKWHSALDKAHQIRQRQTAMPYILEQIERLLTPSL